MFPIATKANPAPVSREATASKLMELFPCRTFIEMTGNAKNKYIKLKWPLKQVDFEKHVSGERTFGGCPNIDGKCGWAGIDVDDVGLDTILPEILKRAARFGFIKCQFLIERCDGRGHIYCIFDSPVDAHIVQKFLEYLTDKMDVQLFAASRQGLRFAGGFHRIKKIWPEFEGILKTLSHEAQLAAALSALRPINKRQFEEVALKAGWDVPTITVDDLKQKIKISAVADRLGIPSQGNKRKCPFHSDRKHFNLHLDDSHSRYYCFRCHTDGDVFNLVSKKKDLDNHAAIQWVKTEFEIPGKLALAGHEKEGIEKIVAEIHSRKVLNRFLKPSGERVLRALWGMHTPGSLFFNSQLIIAKTAGIVQKTHVHAADRLRWCGLIECLPYACVPPEARHPLPDKTRACRYYRVIELPDIDEVEERASQMLYGSTWLRAEMARRDRAAEDREILSQGITINLPDTARLLGIDPGTAYNRLVQNEQAGKLKRLANAGPCNCTEWRNLTNLAVGLGKKEKITPYLLIPPP